MYLTYIKAQQLAYKSISATEPVGFLLVKAATVIASWCSNIYVERGTLQVQVAGGDH